MGSRRRHRGQASSTSRRRFGQGAIEGLSGTGSAHPARAQIEARLAGVVVAALKEAFDRDSVRLEMERAQMEAERRRAEELLRAELRRQAADRMLAQLRLVAVMAVGTWAVSAVLGVWMPGMREGVAAGAARRRLGLRARRARLCVRRLAARLAPRGRRQRRWRRRPRPRRDDVCAMAADRRARADRRRPADGFLRSRDARLTVYSTPSPAHDTPIRSRCSARTSNAGT